MGGIFSGLALSAACVVIVLLARRRVELAIDETLLGDAPHLPAEAQSATGNFCRAGKQWPAADTQGMSLTHSGEGPTR